MERKTKNETIILVLIISYCFSFLFYAFITTNDLTVRGVIITAVVATLTTVTQWRFGSSKSSASKDETIKSMQQDKKSGSVVGETVETQNITVKEGTITQP